MSNPVYFHCPKCNFIRHKRVGRAKNKLYECLRCGLQYTYWERDKLKAKFNHRDYLQNSREVK